MIAIEMKTKLSQSGVTTQRKSSRSTQRSTHTVVLARRAVSTVDRADIAGEGAFGNRRFNIMSICVAVSPGALYYLHSFVTGDRRVEAGEDAVRVIRTHHAGRERRLRIDGQAINVADSA